MSNPWRDLRATRQGGPFPGPFPPLDLNPEKPRMVAAFLLAALGSQIRASEVFCSYTGRWERCTAHDIPDASVRRHPDATTPLEVPVSFDWNNFEGMTLTTADQQQHAPWYCGACWGMAATSTLADRLKIATFRKGGSGALPAAQGRTRDIIPSVQALINCAGEAGSCMGGDALAAFAWIKRRGGVPDQTCQPFEARNAYRPDSEECRSGLALCKSCQVSISTLSMVCSPVKSYPVVRVRAFGSVETETDIVKEVMVNGPVACHINASCIEPGMNDPASGVFAYPCAGHNHVVELAGWGALANGSRYWLLRNSWGTWYADGGWFRILRWACAGCGSTRLGSMPTLTQCLVRAFSTGMGHTAGTRRRTAAIGRIPSSRACMPTFDTHLMHVWTKAPVRRPCLGVHRGMRHTSTFRASRRVYCSPRVLAARYSA